MVVSRLMANEARSSAARAMGLERTMKCYLRNLR